MSGDPVLTAMAAAVELGRAGDTVGARGQLTALYAEVGSGGDPLHRLSIAHFLADLQDDAADELRWDDLALTAVAELTDARAAAGGLGAQVRGLLPSLHLNVADCHRRLGDAGRARDHLEEAVAHLDALADDDYGRTVRSGIDRVRKALEAGSTDRLTTASESNED